MPDNDPSEPRRRFQFSLGSLFLAMLLCSVLSTVLALLLFPQRTSSSLPKGFFTLLAAAAPMAVMIVLSLYQAIVRLINHRR